MSSGPMVAPCARLKTPSPQERKKVAVAVEDDDRMLAARETINLILVIDRDRRHFMKGPVVGQFSPSFDHFVAKLAAS